MDDKYIEYMAAPELTYRDHKRLVQHIFDRYLLDNEDIEFVLEEKSMFWMNDFEQVGTMVGRTLDRFSREQRPWRHTASAVF
jgi:N utilization substance protein B